MKSGKWSKIARSVAGLTLAAGLVALTAGCKGYDIYIVPKDPDASQTEPNKDLTEPEQKDPATPNTPAQPSKPDYTKYSQLLQDVLKSDYYNELIYEAQLGKAHEHLNLGKTDGEFNLLEANPYKFLESKEEDIENIKLNNVMVNFVQYIQNDDKKTLFSLVTLTYQNENGNIMKQYLIKYNISDQEYDDLKMLFGGHYYQADLMVQELDNQRDAELVSSFTIDEKTYYGLLKLVNSSTSINETFNGKYKGQIDAFTISSAKHSEDISSNDYYLTFQLFTKGTDDIVTKGETFSCVGLQRGATMQNDYYLALDGITRVPKITDITEPIPITMFSMRTATNQTKDFLKK